MKLLLTWAASPDEVNRIRRHVPENVDLVMTPERPYMGRYECNLDDMVGSARDIDVIMGWVPIPREVLESARNLKFIAFLHAGCDQLDFPALRSRGIKVSNVSGAMEVAVAEHAFALVLALAKRLIENHRAVVETRWQPLWEPDCASVELAGKTMAIVGLGTIGEEVAKRAKAFGMRVLGVKRDPTRHAGTADEVFSSEKLGSVLPQADFVVLTVPITSETRRLIGEGELRAMRSTAYLINVSRGGIVHEGPLARALSEDWIAGYASDVWWEYPDAMPPSYHFSVPSRYGVHRMPNVVATGDRATGGVLAVKDRMIDLGAESVGAFVRGEVPPRLIDLELEY